MKTIFQKKTVKLFFGVVLLCGAFFSCNKDPQGMILIAEGFNGGSKASVDGLSSFWVNDEIVRINGKDYVVNVADGIATVNNVDPADTYRALYPNTLAPSADLRDNPVRVTIPSVYNYREDNGLQALDLPMVAYGNSDDRLLFKHLTAAITVLVTNNFGIDITIDSIVVTSSDYQISGDRNIEIGPTIEIGSVTSDVPAEKRVVVRFASTPLQVNSGVTKAVQVPVLPVGSDNKFSITVAVHNADDADMKYTFSRTQTTGGTLLRAQLGYAPASFGGKFSVSDTNQVFFAPGNLQYLPSASKWHFAKHQYDVAPFDKSYYDETSTNDIDLFGFATSGYNANRKPYNKSTKNSNYNTDTDSNSQTDNDWGWYNSIVNGGNKNHYWYTLTKAEWEYLIGRTEKVGNAIIKDENNVNHNGLIILPDNFENPVPEVVFNPVTNISYSKNTYTYSQWQAMEIAGAIFLPAAGNRNGNNIENSSTSGYYWTATRKDATYSYALKIIETGLTITYSNNFLGYYVRLVHD